MMMKGYWSRYRRECSVAAAFLTLLLVLAIRAPGFFQPEQLKGELVKNASVLVTAIGMTLVILCRQIDISIGSMFSVCGISAGLLIEQGLPMPMVAIMILLLGAMMGAFNGWLVAGAGFPSIVATLATMVIWREALRWTREGEFVRLPESSQWFGQSQSAGQMIVVCMAFVVFGIFAWSMRHLAAGRAVYATGSDPEAARLAGIQPNLTTFAVFMVMGLLTGLAALLRSAQFPNVDPNMGNGLELQVIAAVVVGGAAISGGRGSLVGGLLGVALLGTIGPALVFLGARPEWEKAIQGLIILLAVASDTLYRKGGVK